MKRTILQIRTNFPLLWKYVISLILVVLLSGCSRQSFIETPDRGILSSMIIGIFDAIFYWGGAFMVLFFGMRSLLNLEMEDDDKYAIGGPFSVIIILTSLEAYYSQINFFAVLKAVYISVFKFINLWYSIPVIIVLLLSISIICWIYWDDISYFIPSFKLNKSSIKLKNPSKEEIIVVCCPYQGCNGMVSSTDQNLIIHLTQLSRGGMIAGGGITCNDCGNQSPISEWHKETIKKFGENYLNKGEDILKSVK